MIAKCNFETEHLEEIIYCGLSVFWKGDTKSYEKWCMKHDCPIWQAYVATLPVKYPTLQFKHDYPSLLGGELDNIIA